MKTTTQNWLRLCLVFIAVLTWSVVASAQEDTARPASPPAPESASLIYENRCAICHGSTGQGDGPMAAQVDQGMPNLSNPLIWRETTPVRWFDIISNGVDGKAMPPFGETSSNPLSQAERWNLVFFLYTLATPPAQVDMGQALYEMTCVECHGIDGTGDTDTPSFTDLSVMANRSQADLFAAIEGHDLELGDVEIWALTDYVRAFSYEYVAPSEVSAVAAAAAPIIASPFTGGEGVISGQVINGTAEAEPPEGLLIRLHAFDMDANFVDAISTTVTADGSFRFAGIDTSAPVQFEPKTVYKDISYFGDLETAIILSPDQPEANVNITVYETTTDASAIRIERLHIVFDFVPGQVQVAELYILSNDGDRVYVGTLEGGTLRLTVPPNALNFQPGGDPGRYLTLADGLADTTPIPPGQSTAQSILVYDLAYEDALDLSRPLPYDVSVVNIFVPTDRGVEISGDRIRSGGPFVAQNTTLETYLVDDLPAGERLTLRLSGEPKLSSVPSSVPSPHQEPGLNETQSIIIGLIILGGTAALTFLYWQGHLSLRLRPTTQNRERMLLLAIADLDDGYEAGQLKEKSYRSERAKLKEELIEFMEREE